MPVHVHKLVEVKCLKPPKHSIGLDAVLGITCTCGGGLSGSPHQALSWWERHLDEHLTPFSAPFVRYAQRVAQ